MEWRQDDEFIEPSDDYVYVHPRAKEILREFIEHIENQIFTGTAIPLSAMSPVATPPGYIAFRGRGTYDAKERLKQLGGYWNPEAKAWFVPAENEARAREQVALAVKAGTLLAPDPALGKMPDRSTYGIVCYQCGEKFHPGLGGALPDEYYCGCVERYQEERTRIEARRRPPSW